MTNILDLFDIARLLRAAPDEVIRLIHEKHLPASNVAGQWQCTSAALRAWLLQNNLPLPPEFAHAAEVQALPLPNFCGALRRGGVFSGLLAADKNAALAEAVRRLPLPPAVAPNAFLKYLLEREALSSTGIGDGIAIPHPRQPLPELGLPLAALFFLAAPIDFQAIDHQLVSAFFVLAAPTPKIHLHIMARLFYLLRKPEFRTLLVPTTPRELLLDTAQNLEPPG